jgi:hypothetical protein
MNAPAGELVPPEREKIPKSAIALPLCRSARAVVSRSGPGLLQINTAQE